MSLIDRFKDYYRSFDRHPYEDMASLYAANIIFKDPIHEIYGLDDLQQYFVSMCGNLKSCRFEFVGETIAEDSAWFKWIMYYQHPRLRGGQPLQITGATYIRYEVGGDKIIAHEDFYDMGSMLYEHTPLLGMGVRWLKQQLAKSA